MGAALEEAASQMIRKKYDSRLGEEGYTTQVRYGMSFCGMRVRMVKIGRNYILNR
ncbi:MAG: hypothetical protein IJ088_14680 [Clostridia bacterium]|nr:hypothetical protein [Clostridia bacterium]